MHRVLDQAKRQELGGRLDFREIAGIDDGDVEPVAVLLPLAGHHRRDADILHRLAGPLHVTDDGVKSVETMAVEYRLRILRILASA